MRNGQSSLSRLLKQNVPKSQYELEMRRYLSRSRSAETTVQRVKYLNVLLKMFNIIPTIPYRYNIYAMVGKDIFRFHTTERSVSANKMVSYKRIIPAETLDIIRFSDAS